MDTFRQPIDRVRFKDGYVPAGMSPFTLLGMVPLLRNTNMDHDPILLGPPCCCCGVREETDGRHRWIANVIAGRPDVLATPDLTRSAPSCLCE
jgi:hypothetical protein